MKHQDVTPRAGARHDERRTAEWRDTTERHGSRRIIDCGEAVEGWPATEARERRVRASDRAPHGTGVYPEQQQAI